MQKAILFILISVLLLAMKNDKPAYLLYDSKGKKADYNDLLKDASRADVVLFGELHNNPICHWLQLELTRDLHAEVKDRLVLGAEMFERDNQLLIDEYLSGKVKTRNFEQEAKLWPNYKTDYKPLLEYARENKLPFIATNIPRRYASLVFSSGFEGLRELTGEALKYFAPGEIPYDPELPGYKAMVSGSGDMGPMHGGDNLPKAQAIKDATMAYSITEHAGNNKLFLHYHGTYHSDNYEGIVWYLRHYNPSLKILTISSMEYSDTLKPGEEEFSRADYILMVPETMTKTH